jgi:hypothetical protein
MKKNYKLYEETEKPHFSSYAKIKDPKDVKTAAANKTDKYELVKGAELSLMGKQIYIPKEYFIGMKVLKPLIREEEVKLVTDQKGIQYLFISPLFMTALNNRKKGRTTSEDDKKKSSLQKYIEANFPPGIISIFKTYSADKINNKVGMYAINLPINRIENNNIFYENPGLLTPEQREELKNPKIFLESKIRDRVRQVLLEMGASHRIAQIDEAGDIAANEAKMNKISEELSKVAKIDSFLDKINLKHYIGDKLYKQVKKEIANSINEYESAKALLEKKHQDKNSKKNKKTSNTSKDESDSDQVLETNP